MPEFDGKAHEYLLFVGCMASFDDRAKKISRSLVKLLTEAKVSFGYMGSDEPCCGETARRGGSESNFRMWLWTSSSVPSSPSGPMDTMSYDAPSWISLRWASEHSAHPYSDRRCRDCRRSIQDRSCTRG